MPKEKENGAALKKTKTHLVVLSSSHHPLPPSQQHHIHVSLARYSYDQIPIQYPAATVYCPVDDAAAAGPTVYPVVAACPDGDAHDATTATATSQRTL